MSEEKSKSKDSGGTFDMYHVLSRWDVLLAVAFIVAFLIFTLAIFLYPQIV